MPGISLGRTAVRLFGRCAAMLVVSGSVVASGLLATPARAQSGVPISMPDTLGSFMFTDTRGDATRPLKVWYYRPAAGTPVKRVLFLLHGSSRTGEQAQQLGAAFAREHGYVLIAPEFSLEHYPRDVYEFGGMTDDAGHFRADSLWSLSVIEHLFDAVRAGTGALDTKYDIVGHSAGGQFVLRLAMFLPDARYRRAVSSSGGRYAFPDAGVSYPYGLGGVPAGVVALDRVFGRDVVLMVGDKDVEDQVREWEPEVIAQARNRFARALRFHAKATEVAFDTGVPLAWRFRIVEGVDHNPPRMVRAGLGALID